MRDALQAGFEIEHVGMLIWMPMPEEDAPVLPLKALAKAFEGKIHSFYLFKV